MNETLRLAAFSDSSPWACETMQLNCTTHTERQSERTGCKNIPGTIHHQHKFHKDNLQLMWKNRLVMEVREVKTAAERERGMEEVNL